MIYIKFIFYLPCVTLSSNLILERLKMENTYSNLPSPEDFIDGPSDEELKRIEEEIEQYSD